ncbi:MAG: DMT family transporter [Desulfobacteraceae bacterium]|nr:DMT family transporter [Desulfobacteraceae bacterium]
MGRFLGIILILISAAAFGAMPIFAKFAYQGGISTNSILLYRFLFAWILLLPLALLQKKKFPKGKDLYILMAMGMVGYAGQSYSYFTALTLIPAPLVAILLYTFPVMVSILSIFFLNEQFTMKKTLALCLAVTGTILVIGFQTGGNYLGVFWGIMAAVIYSVYIVTGTRIMQRNDPLTASVVIIGSAAFIYTLVGMKTGFFVPKTIGCWSNLFAIVLISTVVGIYAFFSGLKITGAVNASLLSTFEPVITLFLAAVLFAEKISPIQIAGTVLILFSAVIIANNANGRAVKPVKFG